MQSGSRDRLAQKPSSTASANQPRSCDARPANTSRPGHTVDAVTRVHLSKTHASSDEKTVSASLPEHEDRTPHISKGWALLFLLLPSAQNTPYLSCQFSFVPYWYALHLRDGLARDRRLYCKQSRTRKIQALRLCDGLVIAGRGRRYVSTCIIASAASLKHSSFGPIVSETRPTAVSRSSVPPSSEPEPSSEAGFGQLPLRGCPRM